MSDWYCDNKIVDNYFEDYTIQSNVKSKFVADKTDAYIDEKYNKKSPTIIRRKWSVKIV